MSNIYFYQGNLYCDLCGQALRLQLDRRCPQLRTMCGQGLVEDRLYPQSSRSLRKATARASAHCASCGYALEAA